MERSTQSPPGFGSLNDGSVGGIRSIKEAVNFLQDKVGDPYITRYINHVSGSVTPRRAQGAIIPDIQAWNYPVGRRTVNDGNTRSCGEAIFEVKTFTAAKTNYEHNNATTCPADRRAKKVVQEYRSKFRKLDEKFAPEIVGDESNVLGPFAASQSRFHCGQVIPLCAGWFGDINEDFGKVIRTLARTAAAGEDGMTISPLVNTDRRGGAFPIMLQQFQRAIGVTIARGNQLLKLTRLHYVRATPAEAAQTCKANHSDYRSSHSSYGSSSWYSSHTPEGYGVFEQFRNGYEYFVP